MNTLKAHVHRGRLILNVPTRLPEGTILELAELAVVDPGDDLDKRQRAALHRSLRRAWAQAKAGKGRPVGELLKKLRGRRRR